MIAAQHRGGVGTLLLTCTAGHHKFIKYLTRYTVGHGDGIKSLLIIIILADILRILYETKVGIYIYMRPPNLICRLIKKNESARQI